MLNDENFTVFLVDLVFQLGNMQILERIQSKILPTLLFIDHPLMNPPPLFGFKNVPTRQIALRQLTKTTSLCKILETCLI